MKNAEIIEFGYQKRLNEVLNQSWRIFKSQFIFGRHEINTEAPFQHHFARIIKSVGDLYSISEKDLFKVDLEKKCENIKGKSKYLDITCEFVNKINCAIELKFKTSRQGAQNHGRIDIYSDIESLELVTIENYKIGKFYMITDSQTYVNESKVGVGINYSTHNGHTTQKEKEFFFNSKGREGVKVNLKNSYHFEWEKINGWYFLELTIEMKKPKTYSIEEIRKTLPNAYEKWSIEDDEKLEELFCEGKSVSELCEIFKRNKGAINSRIKKLELKEKYENKVRFHKNTLVFSKT